MDRLGKAIAINFLIRSEQKHRLPGEFPDGFPPDLTYIPPADPPRGTRSQWWKIGLMIIFFLLLVFVRWVFVQTVAAASPSLSQPPRVFAVPEVPLAQTTRVSVAADGSEGDGHSFSPAVSGDGHWVAFASGATNLTGTPTDGTWLVHLKDLSSGAVTLVSVATTGEVGDDVSLNPALDASGRYVAFDSRATNLGAGANAWANVFVHDTETLTTTLISAAADGTPGNWTSEKPALSADGRYVVFQSLATNLIADGFSPYRGIFVRDRDVDEDGIFDEPGEVQTLRVSQNASGTAANDVSTEPSISANGRWIVFSSLANNLVSGDTNDATDIFLYDRDADEDGIFDEPGGVSVTLISVGVGGEPANGFSNLAVISADGMQVVFASHANNLVIGGTTEFRQHIFVRDWQAGITTLVSQSSTGEEANDWADTPALSENGRWIVFSSVADNLVPSDTNFGRDIFVRDRDVDGDGVFDEVGQVATARVSVDSSGGQMDGGQAYEGTISWDGGRIAFKADANDLVVGDVNFKSDVFLHQVWGGLGADLALAYLGPGSVVGTEDQIRLALQNLGPELASTVTVNTAVSGNRLVGYYWLTPSQGTCDGVSWRKCEFGDVPDGGTVNFSLVGAVQENPNEVYQGSITVQLEATSSTSDPIPDNNIATYTTHFYSCSAKEGCLLDDIVCYLFLNPPVATLESLGGFIPNLALYYHVRDEILTSPTGRAYTDLYYAHSNEVSGLVFADTGLWDLALDGLFQWEGNFTALVEGNGDTAVITTAQIQAVEDFLDALSAAGSPALQQAIAEERVKLPPFESFIGMTMEEARGEVIGYAVYLPSVVR